LAANNIVHCSLFKPHQPRVPDLFLSIPKRHRATALKTGSTAVTVLFCCLFKHRQSRVLGSPLIWAVKDIL
jgi:hypothetical protein